MRPIDQGHAVEQEKAFHRAGAWAGFSRESRNGRALSPHRLEARRNPTPGDDFRQPLGTAAVCDVGLDTGLHGEFHSGQFRSHSAHRETALVVPDVVENLVDIADFRDQLAGLRIKQAVHAGQQDDALGTGELRHAHAEHVVIAEFQLLHGHRIVLIDDRQDAGLHQQAAEGVADVAGALGSAEILGGEQDLGDGDVEILEEPAVGLHQPRLADRGAGLAGGGFLGILGEPERGNPGADRPGGNKEAAVTGIHQAGDRGDEVDQRGLVERAVAGFRQDAGAGLDEREIGIHGGFARRPPPG